MTSDEMRRAAKLFNDEADFLHLWFIYNKESRTPARELRDEYRALAAKLRAMAEAVEADEARALPEPPKEAK